ncbi:MAG: hypothetical protein ACE5EO_02455 [Candidatus Krumholzibacteriia bacterium]
MNCDQVSSQINEMSAAELRDMDPAWKGHIDSCPSCFRLFTLRKIASESLAASAGKVNAGEDFRHRVLDALAREPVPRAAPPGRGMFSWRALFEPRPAWAAVALLLVMVSGYNYLRTLGYFSPAGEVPADMARFIKDVGHDEYLYTKNKQTLELVSGNPEDIEGWFSTRLDFEVNVPERVSSGLEVEGARLWHTVSRLSALVHYRGPEGQGVTLFAVSATNLSNTGGKTVRRGRREYHTGGSFRYNVVAWQEGRVAYALVSNIEREALLDIAADF